MTQDTGSQPADLESIFRRFVMYSLCILLPFMGIVYGYSLKRQASLDGKRHSHSAVGQSLIVAGIFGVIWWILSCGLLGLALMAVLKTINLVP